MELTDSIGAATPPGSAAMTCSLPLAMMRFFGKLPHETTLQFADELRALTVKDKADFVEMFKSVGYTITTK